MKLLFDQNLSPRLCDRLRDIWTDVVHVRAVGLAAPDDSAVWAYARLHGFTIVSKDGDFSGRSSFRSSCSCGLQVNPVYGNIGLAAVAVLFALYVYLGFVRK